MKIRGEGDEDAPLFVTGLFNTTSNTEVDIGGVTDSVTDNVMDESTGSDECYGCDGKTYSLLDLATQLELIEHYTTVLERELREKENLENNPSQPSPEQAQRTDNDESRSTENTPNEASASVTNTVTNEELKVGDRVIYVGKKHRESIGNQVMKVVKISVHWTGNQVTCSYDKGWTTWIRSGFLKKVRQEKNHE